MYVAKNNCITRFPFVPFKICGANSPIPSENQNNNLTITTTHTTITDNITKL